LKLPFSYCQSRNPKLQQTEFKFGSSAFIRFGQVILQTMVNPDSPYMIAFIEGVFKRVPVFK